MPVVSVLDGHSHALAFLGGALGVPQLPLGVDHFGQSGARGDLYRHYGIDADAIARAAHSFLPGPRNWVSIRIPRSTRAPKEEPSMDIVSAPRRAARCRPHRPP